MGEATPAQLLHEAWLAVHVRRFDKQNGAIAGPDCFYAGVLSVESAIINVAVQHGVHPHALRNMEPPPASQRHVVLVDTRDEHTVERVARSLRDAAPGRLHDNWAWLPPDSRDAYRRHARAVLASLLDGDR